MSDRGAEPVDNQAYLLPAYLAVRCLVFIAIAMLLIFVLLPAALVAAAT